MFSRIGPAAYKKDIHNTVELCKALGNPQNQFKSIHIAGTNGKGSTSHMLASALQQQGYKTGLYTSPHLKDFGERIRINGAMIDPEFVIQFTEKTKKICKTIQPSFFELTVAMAFEYFAVQKVDIAVIETGLGGRLDSTNIITPVLSIITNIGLDHTQLLGNTLEAIASEKAGIIKYQTPVVIGEVLPETKMIFENKSNSTQSLILFAEENYDISLKEYRNNQMVCDALNKISKETKVIVTDLNGLYQIKNLKTLLTSIDMLNKIGFIIEEENLLSALSKVKKLTGLRGRWDIISKEPTIIFDVAHNKDGIQTLLNQLNSNYTNSKFHFVLGFVNDKDIDSILDLLPKEAAYYFTNAHIERALPHEKLKLLAKEKNLTGESFDDINKAIVSAKNNAQKNDVIIACGSFFTLAEIDENQFTNSSSLANP
jgi:dihydrofolate synthase/folylpolyglutamate synthase